MTRISKVVAFLAAPVRLRSDDPEAVRIEPLGAFQPSVRLALASTVAVLSGYDA